MHKTCTVSNHCVVVLRIKSNRIECVLKHTDMSCLQNALQEHCLPIMGYGMQINASPLFFVTLSRPHFSQAPMDLYASSQCDLDSFPSRGLSQLAMPGRTSGNVFRGFGHNRSLSVESLDTPPTPPLYSGHSAHSQRRGYTHELDQDSFTLVSVDICTFPLIFIDKFCARM
jgi:hypothetical protein